MWTVVAGLLLLAPEGGGAKDVMYEGTWVTTNRRLDGPITCAVTELGGNRWRGHFYGTWQGVDYSYKVEFSGPPDKLRGVAQIDGADYEWTGAMRQGSFEGSFWGNRYVGSFTLKRKDP